MILKQYHFFFFQIGEEVQQFVKKSKEAYYQSRKGTKGSTFKTIRGETYVKEDGKMRIIVNYHFWNYFDFFSR